MLIQPQNDAKPLLYDNASGNIIARYNHKGKRDYYEISPVTGKPVKAYQVSLTSKKARVDYYSTGKMQIDSVSIVHYNVNLRIGMSLIDENLKNAVE
jgi:hypothetical protein